MAIEQLNEEQVTTWTRLQKDQWWYDNVYRGDMPQLTARAAITGFLLGGVLSATALYIAGKTGITIGVGLTSVILAFALYRIMSRSGMIDDFTILENNCTQSIATAAGYMVTPVVSGLAAYMMVTGTIVPWWKLMIFNVVISSIGVLVAFPMKRRFIPASADSILSAHGLTREGLDSLMYRIATDSVKTAAYTAARR